MALDVATGIVIAALLLGSFALGMMIFLEGIAVSGVYGRQWLGLALALVALGALGAAGWLIANGILLLQSN